MRHGAGAAETSKAANASPAPARRRARSPGRAAVGESSSSPRSLRPTGDLTIRLRARARGGISSPPSGSPRCRARRGPGARRVDDHGRCRSGRTPLRASGRTRAAARAPPSRRCPTRRRRWRRADKAGRAAHSPGAIPAFGAGFPPPLRDGLGAGCPVAARNRNQEIRPVAAGGSASSRDERFARQPLGRGAEIGSERAGECAGAHEHGHARFASR
jgi:hypothetical protein